LIKFGSSVGVAALPVLPTLPFAMAMASFTLSGTFLV